MNVVSTGTIYRIYGEDLVTYGQLPAQAYSVRFSKMSGFYLEKHADLEIKEDKIYGVHPQKVDKVLSNFESAARNLGVILSGDKGIGKSLFAKLLALEAIKRGYPLIIVDKFYPDIASFIESIEQEVVVLFDEFDKTFGNIKIGENETPAQASMLTLFDGVAQGKKLFVITCNEIRTLSDYLINRPGRFHYHFRFEYPTRDEIKEYLTDKLDSNYVEEIDAVVQFSEKVKLNYDCLRAIAFELNFGTPFKEAIKDLNILNWDLEQYNLTIYFEDGDMFIRKNYSMDLFDEDDEDYISFYNSKGRYMFDINLNGDKTTYDTTRHCFVVKGEFVSVNDCSDKYPEYKTKKVSHVEIKRANAAKYHYTV